MEEETCTRDPEPRVPTALADFEAEALAVRMRNQQLGTDQRLLAADALRGRVLTCRQAGSLLGVIQLGIMQRIFAFEVLKGRLSDLPDGLPDLLDPLSGQILLDVGSEFGGVPFDHGLYTSRSTASTSSHTTADSGTGPLAELSPRQAAARRVRNPCQALEKGRRDWTDSVDRLRVHVCHGDVSDALYEDVRSVFDALGLGALPPRQPTPRGDGVGAGVAAASRPLQPHVLPPRHATKLPSPAAAAPRGAPAPPQSPAPLLESRAGAVRAGPDDSGSGPSTPLSARSEESV
mmetsp:Transcript_67788/g.201680  ORF Transcript_67788/g.201680 Transcript_67788/m.201680 type:complete len:291 (-) Transcript_67788:93-965(-)